MLWTLEQDSALLAVADWLKRPDDQVFRLFGYAGTGKTTLARHLAEGVSGNVVFGAYTGKAALVLRQKGCPNSRTIHSMIYKPRARGQKRLRRIQAELLKCKNPAKEAMLREELEREQELIEQPNFALNEVSDVIGSKLLVIDECSMIDETMGRDLLSFGIKILVLGDPAQLPPVYGGGFFTDQPPDVMLTDVQRQARDNPIIALATRVREGRGLDLGAYGSSRVVKPSELTAQDGLDADQIIVGRNATRRTRNKKQRELRGFTTTYPGVGDRLVCLRNERELGLLNGGLYEATRDARYHDVEDIVALDVSSTDETPSTPILLEAHAAPFRGEDAPKGWAGLNALAFDYSYALTCHKSQGSSWNNVMVLDEWHGNNRREWLYTALTRAAERVTVVQL